jgi:hypothetical protein
LRSAIKVFTRAACARRLAAVEVLHLAAAALFGGLAAQAGALGADAQAAAVACVDRGLRCALPAIQFPAALAAGAMLAGGALGGGAARALAGAVAAALQAMEGGCAGQRGKGLPAWRRTMQA